MKLAIAGTGMIVQTVLPRLRAWGWEPVGLCSTPRSALKAAQLAAENDISAVYTNYPAMLAETDAIYLGVPNALHMPMAKEALAQGRHVIVEKPLASNCREAEERIPVRSHYNPVSAGLRRAEIVTAPDWGNQAGQLQFQPIQQPL